MTERIDNESDGERGVAGDPAARPAGAESEKLLHGGSTHGRDHSTGERWTESKAAEEHENDLRWESRQDWESWEQEGN